jgi:hypothetical protein
MFTCSAMLLRVSRRFSRKVDETLQCFLQFCSYILNYEKPIKQPTKLHKYYVSDYYYYYYYYYYYFVYFSALMCFSSSACL